MSPPGHTEVDPEALREFAKRTRGIAGEVQELDSRMHRLHVGSLAFGQFPASRQLHQAYEEIAEACREGLDDTWSALMDIAGGVLYNAEQYDGTEVANTDFFKPDGD